MVAEDEEKMGRRYSGPNTLFIDLKIHVDSSRIDD